MIENLKRNEKSGCVTSHFPLTTISLIYIQLYVNLLSGKIDSFRYCTIFINFLVFCRLTKLIVVAVHLSGKKKKKY